MECPCNSREFHALIERALEQCGPRVYLQLTAWLADHPGPQNPVAIIAPNEGVSRVMARDEAVALLQQAHEHAVISLLARLPPVPHGSVDLVVTTPVDLAIARATPHPTHVS